uniref:Uncharacterized protein n=1 Tax=Sphaerodactylus townsendi TaxID=933632 RepID=A0ACB8G3B2_9SAUR
MGLVSSLVQQPVLQSTRPVLQVASGLVLGSQFLTVTDPSRGPLVDLQVPTEPSLLNLVVGHPTHIVDYKQLSVHFPTEFPGGAHPKSSTARILQQEHLRINPDVGRGLRILDAPVQLLSWSDSEESDGTSHTELKLQLLDVKVWLEQMEARAYEEEAKVMEYRRQGSA